MAARCLFILKRRLTYGSYGISYGLVNSAKFVAKELDKLPNIEAKVVEVIDNNSIDREVTQYNPTHVIIEAIWVVPEKFRVLMNRHPHVKWIVRIHSKPAFLANEGIAFKWIDKYAELAEACPWKFQLSVNNAEFAHYLSKIYNIKTSYSPNIYPDVWRYNPRFRSPHEIHISCFGSVRPMKNHLTQALAAIEFAKSINKTLYFHINADRVEQKGDEPLKNLRALFKSVPDVYLVEEPWREHKEFLKVVADMDLGMQVSLSETFNIVAADHVSLGVPVLVCPDVTFTPSTYQADPSSIKSIQDGLSRLYRWDNGLLTFWAKMKLQQSNRQALLQWRRFVLE